MQRHTKKQHQETGFIMKPHGIVVQGLACALALTLSPAHAQDYPSRTISIVVPYAAGGPTDVSARLLAEQMSKSLGTTIVIDNKPSAGGIVAATTVAKAGKDGYTLLLANATITITNPTLSQNLPYKVTDFAPIALYAKLAYVINGAPTLPVKSVAELIAWARQKPDGLVVATVGTGTQSHILAEWMGRRLGFKVSLVPYKGVSQATADLVAGRVDVLTDGIPTAVTTHMGGKTRIVVSLGQERSILPDGVPTFKEAGYPDLYAYAEYGLMAPAGTPDPVIRKLYSAIAAAMASPVLLEKLRPRGEVPALSASPEAYDDYIRRETVRWAEIIKPMNLKLE